MFETYSEYSLYFKALSDPTRLAIVGMLSTEELCACVILEEFSITQPTLSYHMKILCECGLVSSRKEGKWMYYSLNTDKMQSICDILSELSSANVYIGNMCNCEVNC